MSYDVRVSGTIKITRYQDRVIPLSFIKEAEKYGINVDPKLKLQGLSPAAIREISESELRYYVSVDATALNGESSEGSAYYLEEQLKEAIEIVKNDGCVANGFLVLIGEEQPDISRLVVQDNNIYIEQAIITWPDGTKFED